MRPCRTGPLLRGGRQKELQDRYLVVQYSDKQGKATIMWRRWRLVELDELYDLSTDPAQTQNVAKEHSKIVRGMKAHYETWWRGIEPQLDLEPYRLGANHHEVKLTAYDWWYGRRVYNWPHLRRGDVSNGWYTVLVDTQGRYRVTLRRWPRESGAGICESVPRCISDDSFTAYDPKLAPFPPGQSASDCGGSRFGAQEQSTAVMPDSQEVNFVFELPSGKCGAAVRVRRRKGRQNSGHNTSTSGACPSR